MAQTLNHAQTHTFLLQEGEWSTSGTYFDHKGQATPITGRASIRHEEERWLNRSTMQLETDNSVEFENLYDIEPLEQGLEATIWETQHASLGLMMGTLVVIDDALIMSYTAEGGNYSGSETLRKIDDENYQSWGVLWQGDQKVSSWTAQLKRIEAGKS